MSFTENLELRVVDNGDNFSDVFPQGNYNANKLEEKLGGYLDDLEDLPTIRGDLAAAQNSIANLSARTTANETAINNVSNRVSKIEQGRSFYINENGERVNGVVTRYIVNTTATGNNANITLEEDRKLVIIRGDVTINLYEMLGITSMSGKHIVNGVCYVNAYTGLAPNFVLSGVYKYPTQNDFILSFAARETRYTSTSQTIPSYQDMGVRVVFDIFDESDIPE